MAQMMGLNLFPVLQTFRKGISAMNVLYDQTSFLTPSGSSSNLNALKNQVDVSIRTATQVWPGDQDGPVLLCRPLDINSQTDKIKKFSDVTIKESIKY
jgi:hypothetical protein